MNDLQSYLREKNFNIIPELSEVMQRFDRSGTNNGWFIGGENPAVWAVFGDWKTSELYEFKGVTTFENKEEEKKFKAAIKAAKDKAEKQKEKDQLDAAVRSEDRWKNASDRGESGYLSKKCIQGSFGQRFSPSSFGTTDLLIPCRDIDGKLWGLQKIQDDGTKFFTPGQKIKECFHLIGEINGDTKRIYLCEGFATGASIYMASQTPTVCAFNAANLKNVGAKLRQKYPSTPIVICGDDDRFTQRNGESINTGRDAAFEASGACKGHPIFPHFTKIDLRPTDFNDLHVQEGLAQVTLQLENALSPTPSEIIETEFSGFHNPKRGAHGNIILVPNYEDLRKFFERTHPYRLLNGSGIVLVWNGKYFEEMEDAYIEAFAQKHFKPVANNKMVSEFLKLLKRHNLTPTNWFNDSIKKKINFKNGVLDLVTGKFSESHTPVNGFRYVLTYDYDPNALCPRFDKMLSEITSGDQELEKILLEFAGYALSNDDYKVQKALILEGEGSNGKSTFMNVLRRLAGQGNYASLNLTDLKKETNRQLLDGKLFNMSEETPSRALMDSSIFKDLTGGGEIQARQLYKNSYFFRNKAKLIFACNEIPHSPDVTKALLRRFMIVSFQTEFSKEKGNLDPFIEERLIPELPGIFNRVISAYKEFSQRQDFTNSKAMTEALQEFQADNDPIHNHIKENFQCHEIGNGKDKDFVVISQLYQEFKRECESNNIDPRSSVHFGRRLAKELSGYNKRLFKKEINGKVERCLKAVTRLSDAQF